MKKLRKLTQEEWYALDYQYQQTPGLSDGFSASGQHYILVALLNKFGFKPTSREQALKLAERLLANGWE